MSNSEVVENKISAAKKYRGILSRYESYSRDELQSDIDVRGAVERYSYLAAQATIELAEAFVALRGFRKPTTMREAIDILHEENVISDDLAERLVEMVGFRNIVTHNYEDLDYGIVYRVIHDRAADIDAFVEVIEKEMSA